MPAPSPVNSGSPPVPRGASIVFYDGVCALCNGTVRFTLKRDREKRFFFASLQSSFASELLGRYARDPRELDTMYVLADSGAPSERLLTKSEGILFILGSLGGFWNLCRLWGSWLPRTLLDRAYDVVARFRYRWFGKYDICPIPAPEVRERFLDLA